MNGDLNQQLLSQSQALAPRFARCRRIALIAALAGIALIAALAGIAVHGSCL